MKISESKIKLWSRIGSRATFGMAAIELGRLYDDLIILTGDTSTSAGPTTSQESLTPQADGPFSLVGRSRSTKKFHVPKRLSLGWQNGPTDALLTTSTSKG